MKLPPVFDKGLAFASDEPRKVDVRSKNLWLVPYERVLVLSRSYSLHAFVSQNITKIMVQGLCFSQGQLSLVSSTPSQKLSLGKKIHASQAW